MRSTRCWADVRDETEGSLIGIAVSREGQETSSGSRLCDLGSNNGTWVNEQRIDEQVLNAGDRIRVGSQIVKFLSADDNAVQFHETIYKMTTTDGLTGAYNRQ